MTSTQQLVSFWRAINRAYTVKLGLLGRQYLKTSSTLAEARVLFELMARPNHQASQLASSLNLDRAYLSRMLSGLQRRGLVSRAPNKNDRRATQISLTTRGVQAVQLLNSASNGQLRNMLSATSKTERLELLQALHSLQAVLRLKLDLTLPVGVRPYREGELGDVLKLHGRLYNAEYGYNKEFEAYVAEGIARFAVKHDAQRETLWVAVQGGEVVGAIALVKHSQWVGQLRWLLVSPHQRGKGLGMRLIQRVINSAKRAKYRSLILWTTSELESARRLYTRAGFSLVESKTHKVWGKLLTEERWSLQLK